MIAPSQFRFQIEHFQQRARGRQAWQIDTSGCKSAPGRRLAGPVTPDLGGERFGLLVGRVQSHPMDRLLVTGGRRLEGSVSVGGAKNSALKLMAAALLAEGRTTLRNVPNIADCRTMAEVLERLGVGAQRRDHALVIDASGPLEVETPYELVRRMRA